MTTHRPRSLSVIIAVLLGALVAAFATPTAASAHGRYVASARSHIIRTVHATLKATVSASATATAGNPPVTARVTVRVTASARATATRGAWASARRSAATLSRARKAAKAAARKAAANKAAARARSVARNRALAAARSIATARAHDAAEAAASQKARTLATTAPTNDTSTACAPLPKSGGGTWTCTFDEEFNGTSLDASKWMPITTAQNGYAGGPACLVNSPDNINVSGGTLNLIVRKTEPFVCQSPKGAFTTSYTGGQVATYGKFFQTYGRFAARAKFPAATVAGLQSTLWLWPENNIATGLTGEIDFAEWYSQYPDRVIPYLHYLYNPTTTSTATNTNIVTNNYCMVRNVNAFHEYAAEWTPTTITIRIDGQVCITDHVQAYGASPFNQPFFIALTACLGIGTNAFDPAKTPLPATTQVDWVRAWK